MHVILYLFRESQDPQLAESSGPAECNRKHHRWNESGEDGEQPGEADERVEPASGVARSACQRSTDGQVLDDDEAEHDELAGDAERRRDEQS